jgi:hypothetical protein
VLAAPAASDFETWNELFAFPRRRVVNEYTDLGPVSGAYVFLGADPDLGLVVNPYNTERSHGELFTVPSERFDRSCTDRTNLPAAVVE